MNFSVKFLRGVLCTAAIGSMGVSNNADAADPGKLSETGGAVAQGSGSAIPSPTVPVFNSCSGGSQPCTTTAVCPQGMIIKNGWSFYIVPDDRSPAYGICGTASAACVRGTASCSITTGNSGCGAPGWGNQTALVAIACQ